MSKAIACLSLLGLLITSKARSAEGVVACDAFKARWVAAMRTLDPTRADLAFVPAGRAERVDGLGGPDAQVSCSEGTLSHVEIRDPAPPVERGLQPLVRAAAGVLMAFDPGISADHAAAMVGALQVDARPGRAAVSAWGPYELTLSRVGPGGARFVADFPEN